METQVCVNCGDDKPLMEYRVGAHKKRIGKCEVCMTLQREERMREKGKRPKKKQGEENSTKFLDWMGTNNGIYG